MHHLAIMNKRWRLIEKILIGEKTIESRWYKNRIAPWGRIAVGDSVFFKNSGERHVIARATVAAVEQFEVTSDAETKRLIRRYGGSPGIAFSTAPEETFNWCRGKRYVVLMHLRNPRPVTPFPIDKSGFGNACAWLTVPHIQGLRAAR